MLPLALHPLVAQDLPVCLPGRACVDETPGEADVVALTSALTPASAVIAAVAFVLVGVSIVLLADGLRRQLRGAGARPSLILIPSAMVVVGLATIWTVGGRLAALASIYGGEDGRPADPVPTTLLGSWPSVEAAGTAAAAVGAVTLFLVLNTAAVRERRPRVAALRRQRLVVVCGLGGTGKTTLADRLARELRIACLHEDDVKASLHDAGITTPHSFEVFRGLAERLLVSRVDLIVEATLHDPADWHVLRGWQERYDLDLVCVVCSADRQERERRIRTRERHPAHADADRRQLAQLDLEVDYSGLPGLHIDVRTDDDPDAAARRVLARLPRRTGPERRARGTS